MPADSATAKLGLLLMGTGNDDNTWGQLLNDQVIQYIEDALRGTTAISTTGGSTTLTQAQTRSRYIVVTGALVSTATLVVPSVGNGWIIINGTSGAFGLLVKTSGGSASSVPQGTFREMWTDGTSVYRTEGSNQAGEIFYHAGGVPAGAFECDGASKVRADYPELFAAIGGTWGAADGTHFTLPDLKTSARYIRSRSGSFTVGTYQAESFISHSHTNSFSLGADAVGNHQHTGGGNVTSDPANADHSHNTFVNLGVSVSGNTFGQSNDHTHSYDSAEPGNVIQFGAQFQTIRQGATQTGGASQDHSHSFVGSGSGSGTFGSAGMSANHSHNVNTSFTTSANGTHAHSVSGSITVNANGGSETRPISAVMIACIRN